MYALHQPSKNDWYRIKNQSGGPTQLHIYDEIGYFGVSASDLVRDLADVSGDLEVHINSPGGDVWDGVAIYNALLARNNVSVHIDGIAASIASVIAMAGNPILIARNAQMMIHEGFAMSIGNAQDMRDLAEQLDRASNNIASIYSDHTGRPIAYWRDVMKAETWYSADEAIEAGLADRLIDSGAGRRASEPQDKWDMSVYRPTGRQTDVGPKNLIVAWDPDGDGDNDLTPEGDLDNSHWNRKGKQRRSVPGRPLHNGSLIDIRNAKADTSPWDAALAMSMAGASGNTASFYNAICAGHRDGDPSSAAAHALPHHYHPDGAPNASGVEAALRMLDKTGGLRSDSEARQHLEDHMRAINPDWKPGSGVTNSSSGNWLDVSDEEMEQFLSNLRGVRLCP
jgi:ATP-dependent protease ClpP protease subunit